MDLSIKQSNLFIEMQIPKCWDERKTETQSSQMFMQGLAVIICNYVIVNFMSILLLTC